MSLLSTKSDEKKFSGFTEDQLRLFKKLNTPGKIQDFLETIEANFKNIDRSPKLVLENRKAHCFEGALLAAAILRFHGHKPLLVNLKTTAEDDYHIIAVFKENGCWGAITKTNHAILRYRDPIYKSIRELVMSFFNEYFLENGKKTLRSYSQPIDLSRFDKFEWMTSGKNLEFINKSFGNIPHVPILNKKMIYGLRKADPIERKILDFVQWEEKNKNS